MANKYPASGFWLHRIGETHGRVAITESIWCGPRQADGRAEAKGPQPVAWVRGRSDCTANTGPGSPRVVDCGGLGPRQTRAARNSAVISK